MVPAERRREGPQAELQPFIELVLDGHTATGHLTKSNSMRRLLQALFYGWDLVAARDRGAVFVPIDRLQVASLRQGHQELLHVVLDLLGALVVFGVIELVLETDEAVILITEEVEEVNEQLLGHLGWEALFLLSQLLPDWEL